MARRAVGSWLSGPEPNDTGTSSHELNDYPGQRLGLRRSGSGSLATTGRRIVALLVDWLIAYGLGALGVAMGLGTTATLSTVVLVIWFVLGVVSVRLFGFTPGQWALGLMVMSIDDRQHVGIGRAAVRGLLITLVIPALFSDVDGRGVQDRVTHTAVVRR